MVVSQACYQKKKDYRKRTARGCREEKYVHLSAPTPNDGSPGYHHQILKKPFIYQVRPASGINSLTSPRYPRLRLPLASYAPKLTI